MSEACQEATLKQLKEARPDIASIDVTNAHHAPAPLEPPDGKRLMMVQSPPSALNFFLMWEDGKCHVERLTLITIPGNSEDSRRSGPASDRRERIARRPV